jgi:hypothetical protein
MGVKPGLSWETESEIEGFWEQGAQKKIWV